MVNLKRVLALIFFVLFCIVGLIYGLEPNCFAASASNVTINGGASFVGISTWEVNKDSVRKTDTNFQTCYFSPYLQFIYNTSNSFTSEMKFHFDVGSTIISYLVLDTAYARLCVPTFGSNKLTIVVGKAPISWGIEQIYRGGDLISSKSLLRQDSENNFWFFSISHPIFANSSIDITYLPAIEDVKKDKVSTLFRYSPSLEILKEIRLSYVYSDSTHKASALIDLNLYFDINIAVESSFRNTNDFRIMANLYKTVTIAKEYENHALNLYLSYLGDFLNEAHDLSAVFSYNITDRTSITVVESNSWLSNQYCKIQCSLYCTTMFLNEIELTVLGSLSTNPTSSTSICNLYIGTQIKYAF